MHFIYINHDFQNLWLGIISGGACDTDQGSWPSQLIEIDYRPDKKFRQALLQGPCCSGESGNKQQIPLLAQSLRWGECVP